MNYDLIGGLVTYGLVIFIIGFLVVSQVKLARKRSQNYEWYLNEHPGAFRNGRVHCHACDNSRLSVQRLMNKTYLRAHVCTQCGTTLYHSKE